MIVEDIIDTGRTLERLVELLKHRKAASVTQITSGFLSFMSAVIWAPNFWATAWISSLLYKISLMSLFIIFYLSSQNYYVMNFSIYEPLKGAILFMADIVREIDTYCELDFMDVSSYGDATESSIDQDLFYFLGPDLSFHAITWPPMTQKKWRLIFRHS